MPRRVVQIERWQVAVAFLAIVAAFVVGLYFVTDLAHQNAESIRQLRSFDSRQKTVEVGVCALRDDLRKRVREGEKFLAQHPQGAFGFTAAQIRSSVAGERRTISALAGVSCPPGTRSTP